MRLPTWAVVLAVTLASTLAGCAPGLTDDGAERLILADASEALRWGDGEYGVVLVAGEGEEAVDWGPLAREIAANRMTAVAVDTLDATAGRLGAAAAWLSSRGIERTAYLASGRHGADLLVQHSRAGGVDDQLILISGGPTDSELRALGDPPKLFVAAEEDAYAAAVATHMAEMAAGTWNALLLVPDQDYGLAILQGGWGRGADGGGGAASRREPLNADSEMSRRNRGVLRRRQPSTCSSRGRTRWAR